MSSSIHSNITVTPSDLIHQLKLSLSIPKITRAIQRRQIIFSSAKAAGLIVEAEMFQKATDRFRSKPGTGLIATSFLSKN
jgi:hypothetical protein